jgi:RHS repeat-associated protein
MRREIAMLKRLPWYAAGAAVLAVALLGPAADALAAPAKDPKHLTVQQDKRVQAATMKTPALAKRVTGKPYTAKTPVWPSGSATLLADGTARRAGKLPVAVRATQGTGNVTVDVLDRATTAAAGVQGLLVRMRGPATHVDVDYSGFRDGFSGGASASLGLMMLTGCVPVTAACTATRVVATNNVRAGTLGADVPADAVLAVEETPTGATGDYSATPLKATSTWQAGNETGDFNWEYPLRTPGGLNGPTPDLKLTYSSQSVDGEMAATNNQPSWVGEGFSLASGAIERKYVSCSKDMGGTANNSKSTGDLCWKSDNAWITLNGQSSEMIKGGDGYWHLRSETGDRVELRTGATNGDHDGQWWVVTETDGTQYWFGRNQLPGYTANAAVTNSVWTAPVYGNNTGEPCHASAFADSDCSRAWRWNLDYVVDPFGNTMSYWYGKEGSQYVKEGTTTSLASYDRGGWLDRIDYGTRSDTAYGTAPMQVDFGEADRCITSTCTTHDAANWPDTPWTLACTKTPCYVGSPTFWSAKRLSTVTTKVGGQLVERWTFNHTFPDPGDTTRAGLWLDSISHTGLAGVASGARTQVTTPDVHFVGIQKPNRVDAVDKAPAMNWWRVASIENETGGSTNISYSGGGTDPAECVAGTRIPDKNALYNNTLRCFPVYWAIDGGTTLSLDFFHKYVVTDVTESDMGLASDDRSTQTVTHYDYLGDPAWHYTDDDGVVEDKARTWSQWRGYQRVRTTVGTGSEAVRTETVYFRGMDGDKTGTGTRSVSLPAAGGAPAVADSDTFAGQTREQLTYQDATGPEISATVDVPWRSDPPTATRTIDGVAMEARYSGIAERHTRTLLDGGRGWRTTTEKQTFDSYGMVTWSEDLGDDAVTDDQSCTITDYARVATASLYIVDKVGRERSFAVGCATAQGTGLTADDLISDTYTMYDGGARGAAPTKGAVTQSDKLVGYPSRYITESKLTVDAYGRVTSSTDVRGNTVTNGYVPAKGGPVTSVTAAKTVNGVPWTTTTTMDPILGLPTSTVDQNGKTTRQAYDALGRRTAVWQPNRSASQSASSTFQYIIRKTGGSATVSNSLNATGDGYRTSIEFLDGMGRTRQVQTVEAGTGGGRIVADTFYDSAGRAVKTTQNLVSGDLNPANPTMVSRQDDAQVPSETVTAFDGAGRESRSTLLVNGVEKWHSTTGYGGDRVDLTPPAGSEPTSTYTDALGRKTKVRTYHTTLGGADADDVTYKYDHKSKLIEEDDNVGNAWTYSYDFPGDQIATSDPDAGKQQQTFSDAGDILTSTNAEGKVLVFGYDSQGRKTSERQDSATGPLVATWTYDTAVSGATTVTALGQLISSTSYDGANAFTVRTDGFTDLYQPTGQTFIVPTSETGLAGSYSYTYGYTVNGSSQSTTVPKLGALPKEKLTTGYNSLGEADTLKTDLSPTGDDTLLVNGTSYTGYGELGLISHRYNDGSWLDTAYDYETGTRRLNRIHTTKQTGTTEVADVRVSYDATGNVISNQDVDAGDTQCFGYDYARRLTEAWTPASGNCSAAARSQSALGGPAPYWNSYTYDATGNRKTSTERTTTASTARSYTYPAAKANQPHTLQSMTTTSGATASTASYTYDKDGNTTSRPANGTSGTAQPLTWNPTGTLAKNGTTSYVYDADGNRILKREPSGTTLTLPGQELKVSGGQATAVRYYSHAGQNVAVRTAAGLSWQVDDQQGTSMIEVDATTQAVTKRWFTPFGTQRGAAVVWLTDKGLVNGTMDESGLTHLGAREYDPTIGRFLSADPEFDGDDLQQMEGYNYANAEPSTQIDPDGRFSWSNFGKAIARVVRAVARIISHHSRVSSAGAAIGRAARHLISRVAAVGVGAAIGRVAVQVARKIALPKPFSLFDYLLHKTEKYLPTQPSNDQNLGCGLSTNPFVCHGIWDGLKRMIPYVAGPMGCSASDAKCHDTMKTMGKYLWQHMGIFGSFCAFFCLNVEFQGGVVQFKAGAGTEVGASGGVQYHTKTVDQQGSLGGSGCIADGAGVCVGVTPTVDKNGNPNGVDISGGPVIGAEGGGDADYNFMSWDFRDRSYGIIPKVTGPSYPTPSQLGHGAKKLACAISPWGC